MSEREQSVSEAIRWCAVSVAWASVVGAGAVVAGLVAGAIALIGFGADSITDGLASAVLVWRFRRERSGGGNSRLVEHRAAQAVGTILIVIGLYVSAGAVAALVGHSAPNRSAAGLALTGASILVLPVLAQAKLRLASALHSRALRGDGILSLAGAILAGIALASLALQRVFGWWWCDAVSALVIAAFLLREGWGTAKAVRAPPPELVAPEPDGLDHRSTANGAERHR